MIKLERFAENDFDSLISWISSKEDLIQFAGQRFDFPLSIEQLKQYNSDPTVKAYKVIIENIHIGHAEINVSDSKVPKFCRILIGNKNYRGKGLGQKIVESLPELCKEEHSSNTVELNVFDWNESAIKCYEKVGFKFNREKSKEVTVNGKIWISVNMYIEL